MDDEPKRMGPKPIIGRPMSSRERKQRQRAKQAFLIEAAKESGFVSMSVLLNEQQLLALGELDHILSDGTAKPSLDRVNEWVFYALKNYLNDAATKYGLTIPKRADWPQHSEQLLLIERKADLKLKLWEKEISSHAKEDIHITSE